MSDRNDARNHAPATQRNRDPILAVLRGVLPPAATVLEIASGTGEHVAYFAAAMPDRAFQPSDPDPRLRASIDAWVAAGRLANVNPAIALDTVAPAWPVSRADAVLCINMIHIAPWRAAIGLFAGAARLLRPGGVLFLYGPFRRDGAHTSPGNAAFDATLRAQDPDWGIRDLQAVTALAATHGFAPPRIIPMPANNLSLIFEPVPTAA